MKSSIIVIFFVSMLLLYGSFLYAQEEQEFGKILSISENTVSVKFETSVMNLGDEVSFTRHKEIVDPVTGNIRGGTDTEIAKGVVEELGLGKAFVTVLWKVSNDIKLQLTDKANLTGKGKKFKRETRVVAKIQNLISEKEIEIDAGTTEEISEGDMFLIQRTENIYDPQTNDIIEVKEIEVGKGRVSSVADNSSVGELFLNPGMALNTETDNIVFEPGIQETLPAAQVDSTQIIALREEIDELKHEVEQLKTAVDNLSQETFVRRDEFRSFKTEIESMVAKLMTSDMESMKIRIKNAEPITTKNSKSIVESYKHALDDCLNHKYQKSIGEFQSIIASHPGSKLTENCRYWIAQSYFNQNEYEKAREGFKAVIDDTRFYHKDDDASIMVGITYMKMGKTKEALKEFKDFIAKYPDSEYKSNIQYWLKRLS